MFTDFSRKILQLFTKFGVFIEVSHIVRDLLGIREEDVDHKNRTEMNGIFTWELGKGEHSRILFKKDNVELAELVYNPKHTEKGNDSISIDRLVAPTVPQKPDIVLQLTKHDLQKDMKLTYLFDAKYRIGGCNANGVDTPPEDAINQMHRYRDAIYYKENTSSVLKKEVIGGYILFPGDGQTPDVEVAKFYKSIAEVNIGAFPLRPKDKENRKLIENFIRHLIDSNATEIVSAVIPQKGTSLEVPNRVLVGYVKQANSKYFSDFENSCAELYYTGANFPTTIALHNLHFFMPYFKGKGVRDLYEIVKIRTISAKEAKNSDSEASEDDLRLAFELKFSRKLFDDFVPVNLNIEHTFLDTTFNNLKKEAVSDLS